LIWYTPLFFKIYTYTIVIENDENFHLNIKGAGPGALFEKQNCELRFSQSLKVASLRNGVVRPEFLKSDLI